MMKLIDVYRMIIERGIESDPRGRDEIDEGLEKQKSEFDKMDEDKKEFYDQERLWNPYADSRLSFGDPDTDLKKVIWGIDIGTGEVVLTDRLNQKGHGIDAIIGHHPIGKGRSIFPEVMSMQEGMYHELGIPINIAEGMMSKRIDEVTRAVMASNYNQVVDACRLLEIPLMNAHTPTDNLAQQFMEIYLEEKSPRRLKDLVDAVFEIPEYRLAASGNSPPNIVYGKKDASVGKVAVKMTGGTSGPVEIYEKLADAGVGTVVGMHFPDKHIDECKKYHINVVVAGHMSSDSLGMNLAADMVEAGGVEVIPFSGFLRVSRNKDV